MNAKNHRTPRTFRPGVRTILLVGALMSSQLLLPTPSGRAAAATNPPVSTIVRRTPGGLNPAPVITQFKMTNATQVDLSWFGLTPPFQVQTRNNVGTGNWMNLGAGASSNSTRVAAPSGPSFFRIRATDPAYVGAETCGSCHTNKHATWLTTAHASALQTLKGIGQGKNASCLPCHVVGFGLPNGFVDEATTPQLAGVQCENCHGPGGKHALNPNNLGLRPKVELSAMMCGGCHSDFHHPTYDEWALSKHGHALATIKENSHGNDSCLECHSVDYRYAVENGLKPPTKQTAQLSLECATCHDPHGGTMQVAQLRHPIAQLCGDCHTQGPTTVAGAPHHPQYEMLTGTGAYQEDGSDLVVLNSAHASLAAEGGQACAQCHVVMHSFADPNEGNPNVTGHTFNPFDETITEHQASEYEGCTLAGCHQPTGFFSAANLRPLTQGEISDRLQALAPYFTKGGPSYIDPLTLTTVNSNRLNAASFNYQFVTQDKSKGIHNANYTRAALDVAEAIVTDLSTSSAPVASAK
jgi:predicted CXXCH cytochrome family protein